MVPSEASILAPTVVSKERVSEPSIVEPEPTIAPSSPANPSPLATEQEPDVTEDAAASSVTAPKATKVKKNGKRKEPPVAEGDAEGGLRKSKRKITLG